MTDVHSCSYYCDRPECIKAQRDELRDRTGSMTDRELMRQAFEAMLNFPDDISDEMFESIKALRKRLAQPEHHDPIGDAQDKLIAEQEPVIGKWSLREVYFDEDGEPISHRSPPQRTWVGRGDLEDSNAYLTPTQRKPLTEKNT